MRMACLRSRVRAGRWVGYWGQREKRVVWVIGRLRDFWVAV